MIIKRLEEYITDFSTGIFNYSLFFLNNKQKSLVVSIIHYLIFIIGFYYFIFESQSGGVFRIIFFIIVLLGALSYFIFNRCIFTSIEFNLSRDKNIIQKIIDKYFGKETEGNITSKIVLLIGVLLTGFILLKDYGFFK